MVFNSFTQDHHSKICVEKENGRFVNVNRYISWIRHENLFSTINMLTLLTDVIIVHYIISKGTFKAPSFLNEKKNHLIYNSIVTYFLTIFLISYNIIKSNMKSKLLRLQGRHL